MDSKLGAVLLAIVAVAGPAATVWQTGQNPRVIELSRSVAPQSAAAESHLPAPQAPLGTPSQTAHTALAAPSVDQNLSQAKASAASAPSPQQMSKGKRVYQQTCFICHQNNGEGLPGVFPPLAQSDYLMADKTRSIQILLQGQSHPITVNGRPYHGIMPPIPMNDEQAASVLTFVRNSWGNRGEPVTAAEVKQVRQQLASQQP